MAFLFRILVIIWASPYTVLGLLFGVAGLCTGGRAQIRRGVVEFHGGAVKWILQRGPHGPLAMAITFGHTILGQTAAALDICRDHEHVHVRQYERWGPVFGPAYLLSSLMVWLRGHRAYRDNPFEKQAFEETGDP